MWWSYCHECDSEESTEIRTEDTIELVCDGCGYTEVLTITKRPIEWGFIPLDGDDDPYAYYGKL